MKPFNIKDIAVHDNIPRSSYDLSFSRKFTTNFGRLVPFYLEPVNPTENFDLGVEFILRTVPFVGQVFQHYKVAVDYFYVPNRLLWNHFDLFLAGGYDGTTEYVHPFLDLNKFFNSHNPAFYSSFQYLNSLFDYFDISPYEAAITGETRLSTDPKNLLPFAAYYKIVLDHFTNQFMDNAFLISENIENKCVLTQDGEMATHFIEQMNSLHLVPSDDAGYSTVNNLTFLPAIRPYDYDYFTSSRPEQQHGPVMTIPIELVSTDTDGSKTFKLISSSGATTNQNIGAHVSSGSKDINLGILSSGGTLSNGIVVNGSVFNNVATLDSLHEAERVLEYFESLGITGWKPEDYNLSQFNSHSFDYRPYSARRVSHEVFDIAFGEVFSSNAFTDTDDKIISNPGVGTSTAKGYGRSSKLSNCKIDEYGYIIGIASVYPDAAYSQGCPRHFNMLDRFDYPNPKFANLAMQPIYNRELYHTGQDGDSGVFGYTEMYADYKSALDRVNSEFRSSYKYMSSSRLFNKRAGVSAFRPALNEAFNKVQVNYNDLDRVFSVEYPLLESGPILMDMHVVSKCNRPLPYKGDPRI